MGESEACVGILDVLIEDEKIEKQKLSLRANAKIKIKPDCIKATRQSGKSERPERSGTPKSTLDIDG